MQPLTAVTTRPSMTGWLGFSEPLEVRTREPLAGMLADVGAVEAIYPPPDEWSDTRDRWMQYLELTAPNSDRLAAALATGHGDMPTLRALALAELGQPEAEADLRGMLASRVCHALAELWQPHAARAYAACAKTFNSAVVAADTASLDQAADAMCAAARLASPEVDQNCAGWAVERLMLGLTVDPRKGHVRHIATAFSVRPNKWAAVRELGAVLRAATDPLTTWPELPAYLVVVDENRTVTRWDPLDGPLPRNWQGTVDGWCGP